MFNIGPLLQGFAAGGMTGNSLKGAMVPQLDPSQGQIPGVRDPYSGLEEELSFNTAPPATLQPKLDLRQLMTMMGPLLRR